MNLVSKKICLLIAGGALVLAGCSKKPPRPDPMATAMGPAPSSDSTAFAPQSVPTSDANSQLQLRGPNDVIDDGTTIRNLLQAVYFDFDRSDVKQAERAKIQAAKEYLEKNPGTRILFEGHCDWRGTTEYNLALGDRRAGAAKKYLQSLGVKADRIESTSKGSLDAAKNGDDATMAKDRRADIVIIKAKAPGAATPL